jgi:hypothetical protein
MFQRGQLLAVANLSYYKADVTQAIIRDQLVPTLLRFSRDVEQELARKSIDTPQADAAARSLSHPV